jgi:serine O-acetyltransferase
MEYTGDEAARREFYRGVRSRHPRFLDAVAADAHLTAAQCQMRFAPHSRTAAVRQILRLVWVTDAFLAMVLYRAKARLQALGVPVLPTLLHRLAMASAQVSIGDPVVIEPGVHLLHGHVVIDGMTEIESGVVIAPFVTIGLRAGDYQGPTVGSNVSIGTGAKLIGPINVGPGATIGANAVVVSDVAAGATVAGAPARPTQQQSEPVST